MCLNGYTGDDCSDIIVKCPKQCSGNGVCHEADVDEHRPARCECKFGFTGPDCANFPQGIKVEAPVLENSANEIAAKVINAEAVSNGNIVGEDSTMATVEAGDLAAAQNENAEDEPETPAEP